MPRGPKKHARGFTEDKEKPLVQLTQKRDTAIPESILVEKKKKHLFPLASFVLTSFLNRREEGREVVHSLQD